MTKPPFSDGTGPAGLDQHANDQESLRTFCRGCSSAQLESAHVAIHEKHEPMRAIVRNEMDRREIADAEQAALMRHRERNFSAVKSYRLAMLVAVIALIALGIFAIEFMSRKP